MCVCVAFFYFANEQWKGRKKRKKKNGDEGGL